MRKILLFGILFGFFACTKSETPQPRTLEAQIDALIAADQYQDAFSVLAAQKESPETLKLKEAVHLNYGLFLEYRDSNETNMREKMNNALKQYVEVLKLNPANQKAISEVDQIMGIYSTFPDRQPDSAVMQELESLGFDY